MHKLVFRFSFFSAVSAALLLAGCSTTDKTKPEKEIDEPTSIETRTTTDDYSSINQISQEDWQAGLRAFRVSCRNISKKAVWKEVCAKAESTPDSEAEYFFRSQFTPWKITKIKLGKQTGTAKMNPAS